MNNIITDLANDDEFLFLQSQDYLNPDNFPLVVFNLNEFGPNIVYTDYINWPIRERIPDIEEKLFSLAISYISALGSGQNYRCGVFDLPAGGIEGYRLMLISIYINGTDLVETLHHQKYVQIGIFIPNEIMNLMPAIYRIEQLILDTVNYNLLSIFHLNPTVFDQIKHDLMSIILMSIINP